MAVTINGNGAVTGLTALPDSAMSSGSVIQKVTATFAGATGSSDGNNTGSYTDSGITATITPSSGTDILIFTEGNSFGYKPSANEVSYYINLVGTPNGGSDTQHREVQMRMTSNGGGTQRLFDSWNINFNHTHGLNGSTSITYKVQHKTDVSDFAWARYRGASIVLLEVKA